MQPVACLLRKFSPGAYRRSADMTFMPSPFLALLSGTRQASGVRSPGQRDSFREGLEDIVCVGSKGACAGNVGGKPKPGGLQNWRAQSARARGFTPVAVPTRRKKKEWKQMR